MVSSWNVWAFAPVLIWHLREHHAVCHPEKGMAAQGGKIR